MKPFAVLLAVLALLVTPALHAALISHDGADYPANSVINGQNGGTGWFNAWSGAARTQADGLVFPGLETVGNRFVTAGDNLASLRRIDPVGHELLLDGTSLGLDGTELWLSFLVRREPNFPAGCYGGLSLFNGGTEKLFVGIPTGATHWSLQQYDPGIFTTISTAPVTAGETALLVLRFQFGISGTQDRVELFVNPSPGVLPTTPAAVRTGPNLVFDRIRIQSGPSGAQSPTSIDEIRLGESYADVAPAAAGPALGWLRTGTQRLTSGAELTLPLSYAWPGGDPATLALAVTAANPALLPADTVTVSGTGANRRVTFRPPAGAGGTTTVTATVTPSGGAPVSASVELEIAPAPVGLVAHEPFTQTAGNLSGQGGGTGFASNWATGVPGASPNLFGKVTPSLVFPGLVTTGARMRSAGGAGGLARPTELPLGEDGTVRYVSLLVRPDAAPTAAGYFGLLLLGSGGGNLFAGKPGGGSSLRYVIESGGGIGQVASPKTVVQNEVALLVLKLEFLPGADQVSLFVNPALGAEPTTADAVKTDLDLGVLVGVALNGNDVWSADELRVGTTFESVTPSTADFALQRPLSENNVPEHVPITRQIQTVDPLPAGRTLTFALVGDTFGATIHPTTGEFSWVPGEDEQDQRRTFTVRATSNASPTSTVETSFFLTVIEGNLPPQLAVIPDLTVTEGTPLSYPLNVSDPDRPLQRFNYSILAGPEGFDVSTTGELKWSATAAQLGRSFPVTVQVSDTGFTPIGRAQRSFTVTAQARNGFFARWIGGAAGGDWNDPANWDIGRVPNNSATEVFDVIWDDHYSGTIRVTGDIAVKSFTWSSEGTLSLPSPTNQFAVQGDLRWTDGTLTGQGRLTVQGRATVTARRGDAPPILKDRCQLVFKSFCELESRLWCDGDVLVVVEPTATLGVAEGGGFVRLSGVPELRNEGSLRVWSSEPGVPFIFLRNRGRVTTFAHTLRFQTGAANDLIQEAGGSLDLGAGVGAGATLNGKAVFLAGSTVFGDAHIREAIIKGNAEGRLSFDQLSLAPTAVSRFELAAPRGSLAAIQPVGLAGRLELAPLRGFKPGPDQEFSIVTSDGGISGVFDGAPFGQRVNLPGGGSFLLTRSVDARTVVLGKYRPPSVSLEGDPLTFRLPDGEGELGGCFVAPHPAISLPEGDWAGGLLEVAISAGNAFDRLGFQPNPAFSVAEGVAFAVPVNGEQTVTFNRLDFGEVRITGGQTMTCVLKEQATAEAIVALLGHLRYINTELTPAWFTEAEDRYPARTITVTLTDALGKVTQVTREVTFPILWGISLGDDLQLPQDQTAVLHLLGLFSSGQTLPVPKLATEWTQGCGSGVVGGVLNGALADFPGKHGVKGNTTTPYCCTVYAKAGDMLANTLIYDGVERPRTDEEMNPFLNFLLAGLKLSPGFNIYEFAAECPQLHSMLFTYVVPECASTPGSGSTISRHGLSDVPTSTVSPIPFYALEALMKETADGRRWADLYRQHGAEVVRIFIQHPSLMVQSQELIGAYQPGVAALLAGRGDSFTINPVMVTQVNSFWNALARHASRALKAVLEEEQARFDHFRRFQDVSFSEWAGLLGLPIPWQPRLHIAGSQREADRFRLALNDAPGADLSLWRSLDLKTWERVPNAVIERDGYTFLFTDPAPPESEAFYEVRP